MLVLDRSRALESMLWLSQRTRNAVPAVLQRPAVPEPLLTGGRRLLAAEFVLRPHARTAPTPLVPPALEPIAA